MSAPVNTPGFTEPTPRLARLLLVFAALLPAVPIIAGLALTAGSSSAGVRSTFVSEDSSLRSTAAGSNASQPGSGALVALIEHPTTMSPKPGVPGRVRVDTHTEFGSPRAMWVVAQAPGWLGVVSPLVGNGRVGWMPAAAASLSRVPWEIQVSVGARRLTVLNGTAAVQRYTVAVGAPEAPTPTGRFSVTDRLRTHDPSGPYGCCILALSAQSPHAIQGWSGGDRIAIHSTPDVGSIGLAVSHGCMRLTLAEGRWLLDHIPLGTPVVIGP